MHRLLRSDLARLAALTVIGAMGGVLFMLLGLPAPWVSGAVVAAAPAVVAGLAPRVPDPIRIALMTLLGTSMGSAVTPEAVAGVAAWPLSLIALMVTVVAMMAVSVIWLRRVSGWDFATAFYTSAPGALSTVLALAMETRADMVRVTVAQNIRLFVLVALVPSFVAASGMPLLPVSTLPPTGPLALIVLVAVCGVVAVTTEKVGMPAGSLLGAFVTSALAHGSGLVAGALPQALLIPAFVLLGAFIATRFRGVTPGDIMRSLSAGLSSFALAAAVAAAGSAAVAAFFQLPFPQVFVAFAPGGLDAMTLLAFALGLDPAYVGAHHFVRFIAISLLLPLLGRLLGIERIRHKQPPPPNASSLP